MLLLSTDRQSVFLILFLLILSCSPHQQFGWNLASKCFRGPPRILQVHEHHSFVITTLIQLAKPENFLYVWLIVQWDWMNNLSTVLSNNIIKNWYVQSTCLSHSPETHHVSSYPHFIKHLPSAHGILIWLSDTTRISTQPFSHTPHHGRLLHNLSYHQCNNLPFLSL